MFAYDPKRTSAWQFCRDATMTAIDVLRRRLRLGVGVLGPDYEVLLERLKGVAEDLFRERGETIADMEIVRSEKPALHVFH